MSYVPIFLLSAIDAISIFPLNSELFLLNYVRSTKRNNNLFAPYLQTAIIVYVIPSVLGTILAYMCGYMFADTVKPIIDYMMLSVFSYNINITAKDLLTTLALKICVPIVPISLLNILCGMYKANFICFLAITIVLRLVRILFMYNAIKFARFYLYISNIFYVGIFSVFVKLVFTSFYNLLITL